MKTYRILPGAVFALGDGSTRTGGQTIELADDVAREHAHRIEAVRPEEPAQPQAAGLSVSDDERPE